MISREHNHLVRVQLKTTKIYEVDDRLNEINKLKDMLETIVEWQPNQYSWQIHSSAAIIDIWFKEEQHAILCALRCI